CGDDKNNDKDHKQCEICCRYCGRNHLSTDYNCVVITEYRLKVISEIKHHPECLPPNVQLFIPSQYRDFIERSKKDNNAWPNLNFPSQNMSTTTSSSMINNLNETIKTISDDLTKLKKDYDEEQRKI
ncbi:unnamed protein product, partial [Didymodactylos carnosus]